MRPSSGGWNNARDFERHDFLVHHQGQRVAQFELVTRRQSRADENRAWVAKDLPKTFRAARRRSGSVGLTKPRTILNAPGREILYANQVNPEQLKSLA